MLTTIGSLPIIQTEIFLNEPWLVHGFGLRDIPIEKYLEAFEIGGAVVADTRQIHSRTIHILDKKGAALLEGDGFLTDAPGVLCHVRSADCLPILLADTKHRVLGAVHAGWRGTEQKIIAEVLKTMSERWGTRPDDLKAALGPAIGGHCYEVGLDVVGAFKKVGLFPGPWAEVSRKDRWYMDIAFANFFLLEEAGVPRENIYLSLACTACDLEKFSSFRKEGEKRGEQVSFIIKNEK